MLPRPLLDSNMFSNTIQYDSWTFILQHLSCTCFFGTHFLDLFLEDSFFNRVRDTFLNVSRTRLLKTRMQHVSWTERILGRASWAHFQKVSWTGFLKHVGEARSRTENMIQLEHTHTHTHLHKHYAEKYHKERSPGKQTLLKGSQRRTWFQPWSTLLMVSQ